MFSVCDLVVSAWLVIFGVCCLGLVVVFEVAGGLLFGLLLV